MLKKVDSFHCTAFLHILTVHFIHNILETFGELFLYIGDTPFHEYLSTTENNHQSNR